MLQNYGYDTVSSIDQNENCQFHTLQMRDSNLRRIFIDKQREKGCIRLPYQSKFTLYYLNYDT